jgi:hypothetical protein
MGLVHHSSGTPSEPEVAHGLPSLGDRGVAEAVSLSSAYAAVRRAMLALSGVSLMQHLGRGSPDSLAGVVVTARDSVARARTELARPAGSQVEPLSRRAHLLGGACDRLDAALDALVRDGRSDVPWDLLEELRRVLAATSLVEAGMRQFASTSCAAYLTGGRPDHDHEHQHQH